MSEPAPLGYSIDRALTPESASVRGARTRRVGPEQSNLCRARVMRQRVGELVHQNAREWREKPYGCGLDGEDGVATRPRGDRQPDHSGRFVAPPLPWDRECHFPD